MADAALILSGGKKETKQADLDITLVAARGRATINQPSHGFVLPSYGILPVYYNSVNSQYELANANDISTAADALIVEIVDASNFIIQEGGILDKPSHGLTVGHWYVLRAGLAGLLFDYASLSGTDVNVQYLVFVLNSSKLILRPDPIFTRDFFVPQDISIVEEWAQGGNPTISAGTNRMLFVCVNWEDQTGTTDISSITVDGTAGTFVDDQTIVSGLQYGCSIYRWDEAQLDAMTGNTLVINWTAGAPEGFQPSYVLLEGVDQTSPVVATNSDSGAAATDTLDADVNSVDGGYVFLSAGGGNTGMGFTNNGTGWARKLDLTISSADGVIDDKIINADATPENVNVGITGSNRHVMVAVSLRRQE